MEVDECSPAEESDWPFDRTSVAPGRMAGRPGRVERAGRKDIIKLENFESDSIILEQHLLHQILVVVPLVLDVRTTYNNYTCTI